MKGFKVVKIGGSVLRKPTDYTFVAQKISDNLPNNVCVVTSAMKGHTSTLAEVFLDATSTPDFYNFERFVGMGEVLSAILFESVFKKLGKNALAVLPWMKQWPLFISLQNKRPLSSVKSNELREFFLLEKSKSIAKKYFPELFGAYDIIIIPGFIAKDGRGRIVTLGRGGSDISALLVGELINARELVLLKDIDGIANLDPSIEKEYTRIETINSDELGAIASSGAQVVNPISLKHRNKLKKMKVVSVNSDFLNSGTEISFGKKITVKYSHTIYSVITFIGNKIPETHGILFEISKILTAKKISIHSITISDNILALYVNDEKASCVYRSLSPLIARIENLKVLNIRRNIGKVIVRSLRFINESGIIKKIVVPISREGINIWEILSVHTDIMVFVDEKDLRHTYKIIKKIFEGK
ncbi:MAG: hypothetical protein B5M53_09885 [Candidatus Cloacimonas sp. 4484_209]|nr:MAG: hypothetical protein B5M53_09885 [Candidatus Cloacimonas sp. 4484_209]